ncbi:MAG: hypothetical protein ACXWFI_01020 [Methylobacter sp.]
MKNKVLFIFALIFTMPTYALELGVFEIKEFSVLRGLVEPAESTSASPTVRARIILLPSIALGTDSVFINDANGNRVTAASLSTASPPFSGYVRIFVARNSPSDDEKYLILHEIYPELPVPSLSRDSPALPAVTGNPKIDSTNGALYASELRKWENSRFNYQARLQLHQFLPSMPRNLEVTIKQGGNSVGTHKMGGGIKSIGGPIDIALKDGLTLAQLRPLLREEFSIDTSFSIDSTNFQSLSGNYRQSELVSSVADAIRKEISSTSTSSTGFLFWENTVKRLSTSVNQSVSNSVSSRGSVTVEIRNYDTSDQSTISLMENVLFPKITKDEVIEQHKNAADVAKKAGNTSLEQLHRKYIETIANEAGGLGKGFDSFDALLSLSDGDLLGFLSSGFAYKETTGSSNLTYRQVASKVISTDQFRSFSSQLFSTYEQYFGISVLPPRGFSF